MCEQDAQTSYVKAGGKYSKWLYVRCKTKVHGHGKNDERCLSFLS
jgi:hypothetical protein